MHFRLLHSQKSFKEVASLYPLQSSRYMGHLIYMPSALLPPFSKALGLVWFLQMSELSFKENNLLPEPTVSRI